jgi:hypothetical protein
MELGDLTLDNIKPHVGTTFDVPLGDGRTTTLKLDEAVPFEMRQRRQRVQPKRQPFSLFLLGDPSMVLPQGMYDLKSEALTLEGIFIVPVGQDEQATEYEAVFT